MGEWKTIANHPEYEINRNGVVRTKSNKRVIKQRINNTGYYTVFLSFSNRRKEFVHRLLAIAFIPNPQNKPCVNHIDNDRTNNDLSNLEWVTKQENTDWMIKQGRNKRTKEWLQRLHDTQADKFYKAVIATHIETGEVTEFKSVNSVREKGFYPGNVCSCCQKKYGVLKNVYRGYAWSYAEQRGAKK